MLVSGYDELCKAFDRSFNILVISRICRNRMNAQISLYGLSNKFERGNPEIQILGRSLDVLANLRVLERGEYFGQNGRITSSKVLFSSRLVRICPDAPFGWIRALITTLASRTARSTGYLRRALRVRCLASSAIRSARASEGFPSWRSSTCSRCIRAARRICSSRSTGTTAASGLPLRSIMNWSFLSATRFRMWPSRWRTSRVETFSVIVITMIVIKDGLVKQRTRPRCLNARWF